MHKKFKTTKEWKYKQEGKTANYASYSPCEYRDEPQSSILSKNLLQIPAYTDIEAISVWSTKKNRSWKGL